MPGEDKASARRIEAAEKRLRALELKKAGATYDQIAHELGYTRASAHRAVQTALKDIPKHAAKEVLALELERLDALLLAIWKKAQNGDEKAISRVLDIMARRSKYLGLDTAPEPTNNIIGGTGFNEKLNELLAKHQESSTHSDTRGETGTSSPPGSESGTDLPCGTPRPPIQTSTPPRPHQ